MTMNLKANAMVSMVDGPSAVARVEDGVQGHGVEKFPLADLSGLRDEMKQAGLDAWQGAELLSRFLADRGYGVSATAARDVVTRIDVSGGSLETMQVELEKLAFVM